jgi:hypothetical protein
MKYFYLLLCFSIFSCTSVSKEGVQFDGSPYMSNGGEGIRVAILPPKGENIPANQEWFLSMIQSSLTSDFNKFSRMTVLDRKNLDEILNEQNLSMSGYFSDDEYIRIGRIINAQYILIGSLTKVTSVNFILDLALSNPETGERLASFGPKQYSLANIQGMFAVKDAAFELLTQIGVKFSEARKKSLYETAQASISAETALAKGITAERSGATIVEVMQYYYQAVDYDASMTEAINRLAETNGKLTKLSQPLSYIPTGNIRKDAQAQIAAFRIEQENKRIDEENRQVWVKQLIDCENYFAEFLKTANAPIELVYSTNIQPWGKVDTLNETLSLSFQALLRPLRSSSWFKAAEQTIASVRKGLVKTGRANDWGLSDWPNRNITNISPFISRRINYNITATLLDDQGKIIATSKFTLSGGWDCTISPKNEVFLKVYCEPLVKDVVFANVKVANITDILSISISSVNDINSETVVENGMLAITSDNLKIKRAKEIERKIEKDKQMPEQPSIDWQKWIAGSDIETRIFLGYTFAPNMPIGISMGFTGNRFGGYFGFGVGEPSHSDLPKTENSSTPLDTKEDPPSEAYYLGFYGRFMNNFFLDIGLGFYGNNIYGLYNVKGNTEPAWYQIDTDDNGGFTMQVGLLYSFKWLYFSAGYRQYFNKSYDPGFYLGGGLCLPNLFSFRGY